MECTPATPTQVATPDTGAAGPIAPPPAEEADASWQLVLGYTFIGVGVASLAGASLWGLTTSDARARFDECRGASGCSAETYAMLPDDRDAIETAQTAEAVLLALGGVGVGVGVGLLIHWTLSSAGDSYNNTSLAVGLSPSGASLSVRF